MARFIKVHDTDGEEVLVNIDLVYHIVPNRYRQAEIHWAFQEHDMVEGAWMKTRESYEEVRKMILGGADND